jgi:hypothetical protein
MGLVVTGYLLLAATGLGYAYGRKRLGSSAVWLRSLHFLLGLALVALMLLLLAIGIVGTLGEYGRLGHSIHLPLGLAVVALVLTSAWSASQISVERPWARSLHLALNGALGLMLAGVGWSGWQVVQKYLP